MPVAGFFSFFKKTHLFIIQCVCLQNLNELNIQLVLLHLEWFTLNTSERFSLASYIRSLQSAVRSDTKSYWLESIHGEEALR